MRGVQFQGPRPRHLLSQFLNLTAERGRYQEESTQLCPWKTLLFNLGRC